ncbi:MAG TPA: mycofactocin-coupled SDR family oxidoreductase [Candidatus Dormibacteraeota bacterium]|nr:mycofactocin-coupled SDR family oxidoreductase [Candidatus Dormibacteraeota bacterium]
MASLTGLAGRVAMVTGAGRGLGRAQAVAIAQAGADILGCDLCCDRPTVPYALSTREDLEETARLVRQAGRRCLVQKADAASVEQMEAAAAVAADLGGVDVICANAGVINFGRAWELSEAQWDQVIGTNLKGAWATCRAAVPGMIERDRGGSVILIGSAASLRGYPGIAHYAAAKHGLLGLMRSLAIELAPHRIRVNCVLPGGMRTSMGVSEAMQDWLQAEPDASRSLAPLLPVDLVEPEDVAAAVVWLASVAARLVTGVALPVDAGVQLR